MADPEKLIYPDVLAKMVPGESGSDARYFAELTTNNQDTVVRVYVYWYLPEEGEPVLMIEIDDEDEPESPDNMDIRVRVRRNDGLVYEGTREEQEGVTMGIPWQLDRLQLSAGQPQIKIRNPEASTDWINITSEQQLAIEKILKEEEG